MTDSQPPTSTWMGPLLSWLHERFGHTIPERRTSHLHEVIPDLAKAAGFTTVESYVTAVRRMDLDDPVIQRLIDSLTIKETYFFRDRASTQSLRDEIIPHLLDRCRDKRVFRVWSAGCSTGEELYSIAILLDELLPDHSEWTLSLIGTDLDAAAVGRAKRAIYKPWSLRAVTQEERSAYFTTDVETGLFRLRSKYKRNVWFGVHNLANAHEALPGPGRFDLILCRNVLIYFSPEGQRIVTSTFARALSAEGIWVAGASDPMPDRSWRSSIFPGLLAHYRHSSSRELEPRRLWTTPPPPPAPKSIEPFPLARSLMPPVRPTASFPEASPHPSQQRRSHPPEPTATNEHPGTAELTLIQRTADEGDLDLALRLLSGIIERFPLWAEPYLLAAQVTQSLGRHADAVGHLKRALYLSPSDATAHLRIGLLHARSGQREPAIKSLRNAMLFAHLHGDDATVLREAAGRQLVALLQEETR